MTDNGLDPQRIASLTEAQQEIYRNRTGQSAKEYERAVKVMPGGVPSSFQMMDPWPVYLTEGKGSQVWDVDGNQYTDFHAGFGVMVIGHANPTIGEAVKARIDQSTHFAAPTNDSIEVAEELKKRFKLPHWRFINSGTEATMDATHLARGATGRDMILKVEGSYHGHHDAVMVSVAPPLDQIGTRENPIAVPYGEGTSKALTDLTHTVPFNNVEALEAVLENIGDQVAGMIVEPAMMNINIIPPKDGYLQAVRELTEKYGIKLIFDEVKTGATMSHGGATGYYGVTPDMITLAKATCGGYPGGSIGMSDEIAQLVEDDRVKQYGTFNGNPLVMAAAKAALTEVLTEQAYVELNEKNEYLKKRCQEIIDTYELPAYTEGIGAKGCVIFSPQRLYEYRDYAEYVNEELSTLGWLYHMNNGIFMTPGVEEEWTLSVFHTEEDLDNYANAFEAFAKDIRA